MYEEFETVEHICIILKKITKRFHVGIDEQIWSILVKLVSAGSNRIVESLLGVLRHVITVSTRIAKVLNDDGLLLVV